MGPARDGRPVLAPAPQPEPDPAAGGAQDRAPAVEAAPGPVEIAGAARRCRPRPCTRCWSAAGSTGSPTSTGVTGEPIRRYEHDTPGSLIHVDVKKLGNIPDGGGWRYVGRQQGKRNRAATAQRTGERGKHRGPKIGHRVRAHRHRRPLPGRLRRDPRRRDRGHRHRACCAGPWPGSPPAASRVERVLTDNGSCYRSHAVARHLRRARHHPEADPPLPAPDQRQDRTLPPHPGRRLGLRRLYTSEAARRAALPGMAPQLQPPPAPHRHRARSHRSPA